MIGLKYGGALALVLTSVLSVEATCAWVLWQEIGISADGDVSREWQIIEAVETRDACTRRAAFETQARADYARSSNATAPNPDPDQTVEVRGDPVRIMHVRAKQLWQYRFPCLPDTIDPRGPKGSGR